MRNSLKKSQIILLIIILGIVLCGIFYSFSISDRLEKSDRRGAGKWLIPKGDYFLDSIKGSYHHLSTDFTLVELNPLSEEVIIEGYENTKQFLEVTIVNDTLFVNRLLPEADTTLVEVNQEFPVLVKVGAKHLQSITTRGNGHIGISATAYGSNPDGEIFYKPEDWEKYVLRKNELTLNFFGSGISKFFLEVGTLNLNVQNNIYSKVTRVIGQSTNFTSFSFGSILNGKIKKMNLKNPQGIVSINAGGSIIDSLFVHSSSTKNSFVSGQIKVRCEDFIEADLNDRLDVLYSGNPTVKKKETGYGRVIKTDL